MSQKYSEADRVRLLEAYFEKFGGTPPTFCSPDPETDEYWERIEKAVETGDNSGVYARDEEYPRESDGGVVVI